MSVETSIVTASTRSANRDLRPADSRPPEMAASTARSEEICQLLTTGCKDLAYLVHVLKDTDWVVERACRDGKAVTLRSGEIQNPVRFARSQLLELPLLDADGETLAKLAPNFPAHVPDVSRRPLSRLMRSTAPSVMERLSNLAHMSRVCMMGELATSLAHEIRQPMASARNNARAAQNFAALELPNLDEVREALSGVVADVDRATEIIDRICEHIKKTPPRKERFDLNPAVNEVIALARSAIVRNGVSVHTRLVDKSLLVQGDRVQLQQVVMNLLLNAMEAMGSVEPGGRELLVSSEQFEGKGVLVTVRDSGPGIDPAHLERVFEAFYTTKVNGVGMGLSICRSIIDAHGGRLWAGANEPRGAVFQFTLPGADV